MDCYSAMGMGMRMEEKEEEEEAKEAKESIGWKIHKCTSGVAVVSVVLQWYQWYLQRWVLWTRLSQSKRPLATNTTSTQLEIDRPWTSHLPIPIQKGGHEPMEWNQREQSRVRNCCTSCVESSTCDAWVSAGLFTFWIWIPRPSNGSNTRNASSSVTSSPR